MKTKKATKQRILYSWLSLSEQQRTALAEKDLEARAEEQAQNVYLENLARKCFKELVFNLIEARQEVSAEQYYKTKLKQKVMQRFSEFTAFEQDRGSLTRKMNLFKHNTMSS